MSRIKKHLTTFTLLTAIIFSVLASGGCFGTSCADKKKYTGKYPLPEDGAIVSGESFYGLVNGEFRLDFYEKSGKYSLRVTALSELGGKTDNATESSIKYLSETPVKITVRGEDKTSESDFDSKDYTALYSAVTAKQYGYDCTAEVATDAGSVFAVTDVYYVAYDGVYGVERIVQVKKASATDKGFKSYFGITENNGSNNPDEYDFFIPSILYKDSEEMPSWAIASNLSPDRIWVKETRMGLPLCMIRNKKSGYSVALSHLNPEISVGGTLNGGYEYDVDKELQYGSIGVTKKSGMSVEFCYPCTETQSYEKNPITTIYHPVTLNASHTYKVGIVAEKQSSYSSSMVNTYKKAFSAESPTITDKVNIDDIFGYNVEVFSDTYKEFGTGSVKAAGVPWSLSLPDASTAPYTFQSGFVGQQTSVGFNLLYEGYENGNSDAYLKGKKIIDFWTSSTITSNVLPIVWWDPDNTASGGSLRQENGSPYPCFLRCFIDANEGILDAYLLARQNGAEMTQWYNAVKKVGEFLINNQNDDGSYYRAYNLNGTVCTNTNKSTYQGTSKLNTPIAVRFLTKMYEVTGDERYKTAAVKASEYCYNNLYKGLEKYVGGTPDNPNAIDKEAAIYALYAFESAYKLTGEEKYLDAIEHAAVSFMSWVYCYDFAVPNTAKTEGINPFLNGGVIGFSLISTGHSAADNYSAYGYYEMFKVYSQINEDFYLTSALLLQNNTKLSTNFNGDMHYKYRAIGPEASVVANFSFASVNTWLPWSGVANIEPITKMNLTFGKCDINDVIKKKSVEQIRKTFENYAFYQR